MLLITSYEPTRAKQLGIKRIFAKTDSLDVIGLIDKIDVSTYQFGVISNDIKLLVQRFEYIWIIHILQEANQDTECP